MFKHIRYSVLFACLFALLALFTFNVQAFAKTTPTGNGASSSLQPQTCNYSYYAGDSGATNNSGYNLSITIYHSNCGEFYAVAEGFVPRGSHCRTIRMNFAEGQYSMKTGSGTGPQGAYYDLRSVPTYSPNEDVTADFQNIAGGDLHYDFSYYCVRNC